MVRSSKNPSSARSQRNSDQHHHHHNHHEIVEASSSDFENEESMMMLVPDDGGETEGEGRPITSGHAHGQGPGPGQALSPMIDESMILSDNEEDDHHHLPVNNNNNKNNPNSCTTSYNSNTSTKPAAKKMWTGRTKRNQHANSSNNASSAAAALMVEDKPWRSRAMPTSVRNHNSNSGVTTGSTPKSPSRFSQLVMPGRGTSTGELPPAPTPTNLFASSTNSNATSNTANTSAGISPNDSTKRPLLKYIRGFTAVNSPQSPQRRNRTMDNHNNSSSNDRSFGPPPNPGNWSDNDNDNMDNDADQSSIDDSSSSSSDDMISYSSIDSMMDDNSEDDIVMPLEDYHHHPEKEPGFWNHLPYVPAHFVHDATEANAAQLPYLDPELKASFMNDPSQVANFQFVLDHRFYLRALFQLLAEREEMGVEDSIHDDQNIIKKGPLRKKYLGKANYKYVELRKGNLVYFGNDDGEGRKTIHLRSSTASCSSVDDMSSNDAKDAYHGPMAAPGTGGHHHHHAHHGGPMMSGGGPAMHQAADTFKAGLTSAVNATTSAASTIAGGAPSATAVGFEFHLWVEGKRYAWLANSKNERSSWVNAIRQAMIGDKLNDDDWGMTLNAANYAPPNYLTDDMAGTHEEAWHSYRKLQSQLYHAVELPDYLESLLSLAPHPDTPSTSPALQIPLKCLSDQQQQIKSKDNSDNRKAGMSQRRRLQTDIAEFWDNLSRFDFAINGHVIDRGSPCAAERIVGSLVRCILDYDRSFAESGNSDGAGGVPPSVSNEGGDKAKRSDGTNRISELDAVSYARSILLLVIKSKTSGDVEFAVDNLLKNDHLVMLESIDASSGLSTTSETLHIDVSFAGDDLVDHNEESELSNEASGWVLVRRSKYNSWKSRFCVFSEGVFSYYSNAKPRPHGLRGQLLLAGATLSEVDDEKDRAREDSGLYILRLTTQGQEKRERQFGFKSKDDFLAWKEVIEHVLDSCDSNSMRGDESGRHGMRDHETTGHKKSRSIIGGGTKLISYATDESIRAVKGATSSSLKVVKGGTKMAKDAAGAFTKGATNLMFRSIRSSRGRAKRGESNSTRSIRKVPSMQFLMEKTRSDKTGRREPTVQCVVQSSSEFSIVPRTKSGPGENAIVTVRVKFLQAYLLSGGSSGRLARGDAMLEYTFIDETPTLADGHDNNNNNSYLRISEDAAT